jgi:hypothetical protein
MIQPNLTLICVKIEFDYQSWLSVILIIRKRDLNCDIILSFSLVISGLPLPDCEPHLLPNHSTSASKNIKSFQQPFN